MLPLHWLICRYERVYLDKASCSWYADLLCLLDSDSIEIFAGIFIFNGVFSFSFSFLCFLYQFLLMGTLVTLRGDLIYFSAISGRIWWMSVNFFSILVIRCGFIWDTGFDDDSNYSFNFVRDEFYKFLFLQFGLEGLPFLNLSLFQLYIHSIILCRHLWSFYDFCVIYWSLFYSNFCWFDFLHTFTDWTAKGL